MRVKNLREVQTIELPVRLTASQYAYLVRACGRMGKDPGDFAARAVIGAATDVLFLPEVHWTEGLT